MPWEWNRFANFWVGQLTHSALFDANFADNGATGLIVKHELYIGGISAP